MQRRSPQYPAISLGKALEKLTVLYANVGQDFLSKSAISKAMGYSGLNGKSIAIVSSCIQFGLLEGRGAQSRVSNLAAKLLTSTPFSKEHTQALCEAGNAAKLHRELRAKGLESGENSEALTAYLLKKNFNAKAANSALQCYRVTKRYIEEHRVNFEKLHGKTSKAPVHQALEKNLGRQNSNRSPMVPVSLLENEDDQKASVQASRQERISLDCGDVTIIFPAQLSRESARDFVEYLQLFSRKVERRARDLA